jgi:hypothetical protein
VKRRVGGAKSTITIDAVPTDGAPLAGHQLCQMQQFFVLLSVPLCFLNARIKPFIPTCLALHKGLQSKKCSTFPNPASTYLFGSFTWKQRSHTRPVVLSVFHDSRLQDFILCVLPHTSLDYDPHGDKLGWAGAQIQRLSWAMICESFEGKRRAQGCKLLPLLFIVRFASSLYLGASARETGGGL